MRRYSQSHDNDEQDCSKATRQVAIVVFILIFEKLNKYSCIYSIFSKCNTSDPFFASV